MLETMVCRQMLFRNLEDKLIHQYDRKGGQTSQGTTLTEQKREMSSRLFLYLNPKCPLIGAVLYFIAHVPPKGH
jgi:hypothetical protein